MYTFLKKFFAGPLARVLFRPWIEGAKNIPEKEGVVIASNHLAFCDSLFIPLMIDREINFLAKSEYFTGKGIKGRLMARFFKAIRQIPLDRSGGAASAKALDAGVEVLKNGGLLGIYPEGTRSPDGRLYRGRFGVARLALTAQVPVVPVALIGTNKVQPPGKKMMKIARVGVVIGEPLDFSRYYDLPDDRFVLRSVTDEVMYEIMRLSGQEYVDMYGSTAKERLGSEQQQEKDRKHRHGRKRLRVK